MRRPLTFATTALSVSLVSLWLGAGAAFAAGPPPATTTAAGSPPATTTPATTTPATTTPATTTPAAPVAAQARLSLVGALAVRRDAVTVTGHAIAVHGVVRPYVAGQWVTVQTLLGSKVIRTDRLRIKPAGTSEGAFTERVQSPGAGIVRIKVIHARTPQMEGFLAQRGVTVLPSGAGPGARGLLIDLVQQRLAALHVYMPQSGVFDQQTALALDAYHRLLGWGEGDQRLDARTVTALLDRRGAFTVRYPHDGLHAEGDLGDQLLALVDGARVVAIYPISSGKPSTPTVLGHYRIYYRVPGYLPDGMYFSSFFTGGYAIHGYDPAPDYPASHGCMRLPISDAIGVFDWLRMGDWVDVYP